MNSHLVCKSIIWLTLITPLLSKGQVLPNTSYETWVSSGRPAPFNWEEPQGWKSTNAVTEFIAAGITQSSDAFLGNSAADIRSLNVFGNNVPGILANGNPPLDFANNTLVIEKGGTPISSKPLRLTGHYKFTGVSATDSAYVVVLLKKYDNTNNKIDTIGLGEQLLAAQASYTNFIVPISYTDTINNPDSVVVAFFSSNPMNPQANNSNPTGLIVDNIALDFTSGIDQKKETETIFEVFPNPFSSNLFIRSQSIGDAEINIYSITGRLVQLGKLSATHHITEINTEKLQSGIYFIEVNTRNGKKIRQKLIRN